MTSTITCQCDQQDAELRTHTSLLTRRGHHVLLLSCKNRLGICWLPGLFLLETVEALERVNRVNLMGVIYTLKAALPGMVERGQGHVLMMSSMMAMFGNEIPTSVVWCIAHHPCWQGATSMDSL